MFDFVRKHTRVMMFGLFLLIIPAFVLFGVDQNTLMADRGVTVARVSGHDITQAQWDAAHKAEADRIAESMPSIDHSLLDSSEARYASLERLVRDRVLLEAAGSMNLLTSDARLARQLRQDATIASLRKPDGSIDMERYRQLAASQGLTPEGFEAQVRRDMATRQVETGITSSGFAVKAMADVALNAFHEKREVQLVRFMTADYAARVTLTDAELETFYKANQALFQASESANIEYVVLDLEAVKKNIVVSETDLKAYYDQNAARLSGTEERRASHILITAAKDASAAEREKAKARAQDLLVVVRKTPEGFADLALKNSQDPGSAKAGGDLDFFTRGSMVKPFEDAAFAMNKGAISDVIESDFGFHIIKLTDIKSPKRKTFEEAKAAMEAELRAQQANSRFAEAAESFSNGVYEQSDTLKPVAERLKLDVKTVTALSRKPDPKNIGILSNAKFLEAVFSPDAIENKRNTKAIETAPNQLVSARITQYTPIRIKTFGDVRDLVRNKVVAAKAAELARKDGQDKLAALKTASSAEKFSPAVMVSRIQRQDLPAPVLDAALRSDTSTLPSFSGVDLGTEGYVVVRVNSVVPRTGEAQANVKQELSQYAQVWTQAENLAYYNVLKERFKGQIKTPRPVQATFDSPLLAPK